MLTSIRTPGLAESGEVHQDSGHGSFFLRAMAKMNIPPDQIMNIAEKFNASKSPTETIINVIQECVYMQKIEYGQKIYDTVVEKYGEKSIHPGVCSNFIRSCMIGINRQEDAIKFLLDMCAVGLKPLARDMSDKFLPKIMSLFAI